MTKKLRVSIESFAHELQNDIARLIDEYPNGIYYSVLADEYGESVARIVKAVQILIDRQHVEVRQAASNAYFIVPKGYVAPQPLIELTDLQRRLIYFLYMTAVKARNRLLTTNYSQLARIMSCSYGGLITAVNRLVVLEYLEIRQQSPLVVYIPDKVIFGITGKPPTF